MTAVQPGAEEIPMSPDTQNGARPPLAGLPGISLSDNDRRTMRRALRGFKTARADLRSGDAEKATAAGELLIAIVSYLAGFVDGKGVTPAHPGYLTVLPSVRGQAELDACLDQVQVMLEQLAAPPTKVIPTLIVLGAELVVGGIGLRMIADALDAQEQHH